MYTDCKRDQKVYTNNCKTNLLRKLTIFKTYFDFAVKYILYKGLDCTGS